MQANKQTKQALAVACIGLFCFYMISVMEIPYKFVAFLTVESIPEIKGEKRIIQI
jgi:hypothetical protein